MVIKNASQKPNVVCFFVICYRGAAFLRNSCKTRLGLHQSWKSSVWAVVAFCCRVKQALALACERLSPGSTGPSRGEDRRLSAGCPARPGLSPLISLEELWKCVMQKWVDGEAVWEFFLRGWMFVCCVCVSVKWEDTRVGFCCIRWPKCKLPFEANFAFAYRCPVVPQTQDICSFEYR